MSSSELTPLRLSRLELESVVEGSESGVGLGFLNDYPLVGGGEVTDPDTCGKFSNWRGCLDVATHETVGYSGVFTRKIHYSCGNLRCPVCARVGWATKEARKVEARLNVASERCHLPVEHISISFDPKFYGIGDEKVLRKMALKACDDLGIFGDLIFHGSRHRRFTRINGDPTTEFNAFRQFGTDWQPHYHELGFVKGGYTCRECRRKCFEGCGGFNDRRWQYAKKTGVYVKVIVRDEAKYLERRSIKWTAWYQLHHSSIRKDAKRAHVGTWHGAVSYSKMGKIEVLKEAGVCPVCEEAGKKKALDVLIYTGKKNFVLNRYDPSYEKDSMQDLYEDGLQVWYIKPKRERGSPIKNGFVLRFEGGKHG